MKTQLQMHINEFIIINILEIYKQFISKISFFILLFYGSNKNL